MGADSKGVHKNGVQKTYVSSLEFGWFFYRVEDELAVGDRQTQKEGNVVYFEGIYIFAVGIVAFVEGAVAYVLKQED